MSSETKSLEPRRRGFVPQESKQATAVAVRGLSGKFLEVLKDLEEKNPGISVRDAIVLIGKTQQGEGK